ncbi:MAG: hypothetical protein K6T73_06940 [Candidatus Bathyarchaeota archaeon]|nr:hypothetical protein [Candidatus Bathyarchaeota archaeon]
MTKIELISWRCPSCGHDNPPSHFFICQKCGHGNIENTDDYQIITKLGKTKENGKA